MFSLPSPPQPSTFFAATRPHFTSHAPQTPSPLRTWRNANLMPMPIPTPKTTGNKENGGSSPLGSSPLGKYADENARPVEQTPGSQTPYASGSKTISDTTFVFGQQTQSQQQQHVQGQWESRARSNSPAAALARHSVSAREKKKSQFLDRIRRRRDDERSDGMGEQVLRMDFVRERRMWEDEMRRRAVVEGDLAIDPNLEMDIEDEGEDAQAEMSPTEEFDPELDALAYQYPDGNEFLVDEDDEYDEVFREILLAEETGVSTDTRPTEAVHEYEAGMDLS
ncbi:hypothetical protein EDD37DRAFT_99810 [Exophiala viscosa]|uniref:uncharacterized protein n=1 Tax=Exophiala viscosa TaxID=2486360 RepID=UPI0021939C1D|nr:hypothetical protein EDD37DRAFT_99810 [Exophiala viscosa]